MSDEIIIDLGNVWIINGNRFTKALYGDDIETAKQYAKTLINCFDCMDCANCINCNHCVGCNNCKDCEHCFACNNCDKCAYCSNCNDCSECENIVRTNRARQNTPQQIATV